MDIRYPSVTKTSSIPPFCSLGLGGLRFRQGVREPRSERLVVLYEESLRRLVGRHQGRKLMGFSGVFYMFLAHGFLDIKEFHSVPFHGRSDIVGRFRIKRS